MLGQSADEFLKHRELEMGERLDNLLEDVVVGI